MDADRERQLYERVARLEVKMNVIGFIAGASFVAALATLVKLLG